MLQGLCKTRAICLNMHAAPVTFGKEVCNRFSLDGKDRALKGGAQATISELSCGHLE